MKKTIVAAAVLAALALTGCTAGNQSAEATPSATSTPSVAQAAISEPAAKVWSDELMDAYMLSYGANSFEAFGKDSPQRSVIKWKENQYGALVVTVSGNDWSAEELGNLSGDILKRVSSQDDSLFHVIAQSESGEIIGDAQR